MDLDGEATGEMVPVLASLWVELGATAGGWKGWPVAGVGAQLWVRIIARLRA